MRRRALAVAMAGALTVALAACGAKSEPAPTVFSGFVADTTFEILSDSPELATETGLSAEQAGAWFADRLDDRSARAVDLRRGAAQRRYAQILSIDRATLSDSDKITYDVLSAALAAQAAGSDFAYGRWSALGGFTPYVLSQIEGAYITLPGFFTRDIPVRSLGEAELYLKRLDQVDDALDAEVARARADARLGVTPPDFIIDRAIAQVATFEQMAAEDLPYVSGLRVRLEALVGALPPNPVAEETAQRTKARALLARAAAIAVRDILPAYRRTRLALLETRARASAEPGVWRLPHGDSFYRAALRAQTSSALTPDQIHAIGLARVRALAAETDMMLRSQGLADGSVGQRLAQLSADPRYQYPDTPEGRTAALGDVQARIKAVQPRLKRWFRASPSTAVEVRAAPSYMTNAFTGGYYRSPPLQGEAAGVFVINLNSRAGLDRIDLPTLVYHETLPGHHLQVASALSRRDLPILRRLIGFNAFTEGWGLYAEQLADEMGLYDGDPIGRIGYLRWQLWRAARLVVDTGIHAKRWSKAQAIAYLAEATGDAPDLIEAEVERYAASPGQACGYELGRLEIVRLRDKARTALGGGFDIRDFHEALLTEGDLPLPLMEAHVDAWLAKAHGGGNRILAQ